MKKILTLAIIAALATDFANASNVGGGKTAAKTSNTKSNTVKYVKFTTKDFSIKKMQDTKYILMPYTPKPAVDNTPAKG